jgi:proline dehydrogenase
MGIKKELDFNDTYTAFKSVSNFELKKKYAIFGLLNQKVIVNIGTYLVQMALNLGLPVRKIIEKTIFDIFCGGENLEKCKIKIEDLSKDRIGAILDYSVEGEDDEESFEKTKNNILETIMVASKNHSQIPFAVFKVSGIGNSKFMQAEVEKNIPEIQKTIERFDIIIKTAVDNNVKILIDAEETWIQDFIDDLALKAMKKYNINGKNLVYNTYQMYRKAAFGILKNHLEIAKNEKFKIGAKIVRGAYMEKERERAAELNYEDPIQVDKNATDTDFNAALKYSFDNLEHISLCIGTHNEESTQLGVSLLSEKGLDSNDSRIYFAQLLGMCDTISYKLAENKFNVAKYVPFGPLEAVIPYLFRRAKENTSVAGQSSREFSLIKNEMKRRKLNG